MHLAEFNIGTLKYDWEDPRVADFLNNLDRVYGGNPRTASTLSVWQDVDSFRHFVFQTVHKQFYDRKAEWYDLDSQGTRLVMWWVPEGHIPTITEAMERFHHLEKHGNSDHAFGWSHLKDARQRSETT